MSEITFALTIDPKNKKVAVKAMELISLLADVDLPANEEAAKKQEVVDPEVVEEKTTKKTKTRKSSSKKKAEKEESDDEPAKEAAEEKPAKEEKPTKEEKSTKKEAKKDDSDTEVTVEDLRTALREAISGNAGKKAKAIEKLDELETSSISKLAKEHYSEMYEFLVDLKAA